MVSPELAVSPARNSVLEAAPPYNHRASLRASAVGTETLSAAALAFAKVPTSSPSARGWRGELSVLTEYNRRGRRQLSLLLVHPSPERNAGRY